LGVVTVGRERREDLVLRAGRKKRQGALLSRLLGLLVFAFHAGVRLDASELVKMTSSQCRSARMQSQAKASLVVIKHAPLEAALLLEGSDPFLVVLIGGVGHDFLDGFLGDVF
jgi:hypothetical protein